MEVLMAEQKIYNDKVLEFLDSLTLHSGDIANRTRIMEGGSLIVEAGATANSTFIDAANSSERFEELSVSGTANSVNNKGGLVKILDGGTGYGLTVSDKGTIELRDGGTANGVTIRADGTMLVFAGGSLSSATVESGGKLQLESGTAIGEPVINAGGVLGYDFNCSVIRDGVNILNAGESANYSIRKDAVQTVESGWVSTNASVEAGGIQRVLDGGTAVGTVVADSGKLIVERGGTALNVIVERESDICYDFGTTVTAKTKQYGELIESTPESSYNYAVTTQQDVLDWYIAFGGSVLDGAVQNVHAGGEASYITVNDGGVQNVLSGGRANVTTVYGEMIVESGAVANYTEVGSGTMTVRTGGIVNNLTVSSVGTVKLEAGAILNGITAVTGEVQAEGSVTVAGELNFNLVEPGFLYLPVSPDTITAPLLNDITCFESGSFTITISPDSAKTGEYRLAGNAADFNGSVSVIAGNNRQVYSVLNLTDSRTLARNGYQYELARNSRDELVLRVEALPAGADTEAPLKLGGLSTTVYAGLAATLYWDFGVDNIGVTGYEVRYAADGDDLESAAVSAVSQAWFFLGDLDAGGYRYQVRAVDAAGNRGEWSDETAFLISNTEVVDSSLVMTTKLWGHDYLNELYTAPVPAWSNDVSGYYFADAEKLNTPQDMLYCWGAATANILTWSGWAANSPYAFRNEDETFEYFINYWKNEGGQEMDALTWFLNGTGETGTMTVPAEGGNLFPQLDVKDYTAQVEINTETSTLLNILADYFDAGYGVSYAIYSDAGLAHAITGWGYEVDDSGKVWLYYSDSDSDYWAGSWDRREAVNRLSKTRAEIGKDGRLYFSDYMVPGAYLGSFSAIRQFDKIFLGEHETFDDARVMEFDGSDALRAGNLDGENDDDYYAFSMEISSEVQVSVTMATLDPVLAGITVALYDAGKNLILSRDEYSLNHSFTFDGDAGKTYYLLIRGNACTADGQTVPTIDTYYVRVTADPNAAARKNAGISSADDSWDAVIGSKQFARTIPGTEARLNAQSLFAVPMMDAEGKFETETANWVGPEDRVDMRALEFETSGRYSLAFSAVDATVNFTVYQLVNDKLKQVRRISIGPKTKESKRVLSNLLLDAGSVYFVKAESKSKTGAFYDAELSGEVFTKADNGDDTEAGVFSTQTYSVATAKTSEAAGSVALSLFGDNWVGYNDRKDFRVLELADAGSYTFSLSELEKKASGTLTLWSVQEDGRRKKVFSLSGSTSKIKEKTGVLLEKGTYLVSFESKSWKKGNNTDYAVSLSGTAYGKADSSNDTWQNAAEMQGTVTDEWVGFSDLQDWRRFTVDTDGLCRLDLSGVTGNDASVALYRQNLKGSGEKNPSKIASAKAKDGMAGIEEFLSAGTYYIAVKAEGRAKKGGTSYNLSLNLDTAEQRGMLA